MSIFKQKQKVEMSIIWLRHDREIEWWFIKWVNESKQSNAIWEKKIIIIQRRKNEEEEKNSIFKYQVLAKNMLK